MAYRFQISTSDGNAWFQAFDNADALWLNNFGKSATYNES